MTKKPILTLFFSSLLTMTGCSTLPIQEQKPKETVGINLQKQRALVFYKQTDSGEKIGKHDSIYHRFLAHFGNTNELKIITPKKNEIIKFTNDKDYYFQNKKTNPSLGLMLSNGKDIPKVVSNPSRYIEEFEKYFDTPFRDQVYYKERKERIKKQNIQKAQDILKTNYVVIKEYATAIQKNPYSLYIPKNRFNPKCKNDVIVINEYYDSSKKRKTGLQVVELFDKNNQIIKRTELYNKNLRAETTYYRDAYSLIDSIIKIDTKGVKTKEIFKYNKDYFAILSEENKKVYLKAFYKLDPNTFLPVYGEKYDAGGEMEGFPKNYKYDNLNRIIEEDEGVFKILYTYKNPTDLNYSNFKKIENKKIVAEKNVIFNKKKQRVEIKQDGKTISKSVTRTEFSKCKETRLEYNNGKFTSCFEYIYQ